MTALVVKATDFEDLSEIARRILQNRPPQPIVAHPRRDGKNVWLISLLREAENVRRRQEMWTRRRVAA